ncbi:MAG: hypothetical protein E7589_08070 [Ruminococcaceae bacterium]|nr:hypothetical protein [Oscillospiraceae bacterium]
MKRTAYVIATIIALSVLLSACNTGNQSDTTDTAAPTSDTVNTYDDVFSDEEYKSYTSGVKVDFAGNREIFNAQISGEDNAAYVSFIPISYDGTSYEKDDRVCYKFDNWIFDKQTDEKVYFEGNKTLSVITPQAMLSAVFKSSNSVTRPEDYGYVRDTLAQLTFTEASQKSHTDRAGNNAVHLTVLTWDGDKSVQSMRYTVNYSTGKVDLVKTEGDIVIYYSSEERIPEEAIAYFILLAADMDHGVSTLYNSDSNLRLGESAVYKDTVVNYEDIKAALHSVMFNGNQEIRFPTVINNVTDIDTYTDSEAIYFPLGDALYYMLTPNGSLYEVMGIRTCTPYIAPGMTHLSYIHAPIVRKAEGSFGYEAVKALLTGTAAE